MRSHVGANEEDCYLSKTDLLRIVYKEETENRMKRCGGLVAGLRSARCSSDQPIRSRDTVILRLIRCNGGRVSRLSTKFLTACICTG